MEDVIEKAQGVSKINDDVKEETENISPESICNIEEWIALLKKKHISSIYDYYL